ncbi:MAG: hypothetical protein OD814_000904 [Candidatus Alkanophagales archaeon MCA70_species_1]|nr:hypothetical protein [Candidatus Alkanophaga volatiphilum]
MQVVKEYDDWMYRERGLSPCWGYNEPDEVPARVGQVDLNTYNVIDEWFNKHPREKGALAHRIGGRKNRTMLIFFDWLNGGAVAYWTLGQYPKRKGERACVIFPVYNFHDRQECEYASEDCFKYYEILSNISWSTYTIGSVVLWHWSGSFWRHEEVYLHGFLTVVIAAMTNYCAMTKPPCNDEKIFELWEEAKWRRAKIKKLKAWIKFLKEPTLLNLRKAELKAAKADYWPYRRLIEVRWPEKYLDVWELKQEIKKLRRDRAARERRSVEELLPQSRIKGEVLMFEPLHKEGVVRFKPPSSVEEAEAEITKEKERIAAIKKERKELLRKMRACIREKISRYPAQIRAERAALRTPRERLYRKALKERGRIIEYLEAKEDQFRRDMIKRKDPYLRDRRIYFKSKIPFYTHMCEEPQQVEDLRGQDMIEELYPNFIQRRQNLVMVRRRYKNSCKVRWIGSLIYPTGLSTLLSNDSQGEHTLDVTRLVFRQRRQNRGMGEWKVLTRSTRQQIRYPLMIRPLRLKNGHAVYGEVMGAEECRPLAPSDIWRTHKLEPWLSFTTHLLTESGLWRILAWHPTHHYRYRRPFIRLNFSYNVVDNILDFLMWNVW